MKKKSIAPVAPQPAETHQTTDVLGKSLTTNQGIPVSDNQNSLKAGPRGPVLLEDFVLREKMTHFDHERIPERVVHARGSGAFGFFQCYESCADITKAGFLQDPRKKTEIFARFSTVAGGAGSVDTPRDVRGFAVKFYTMEGNYDLVGNNIPVFFIQDSIKFPDLVHALKMEPDRGFPQAATAHDNFWDFISLTPESMHMVMWIMSDRTLPRTLRMIEGFGVHTYRMINAQGQSVFVKFHWRPILGMSAMVWDEAVKTSGADPDFHRRDLWTSIDQGNFPEWELSLQVFDQKTADSLDFDELDPTKVIPEEIIPLRKIGKMVLNRNPDNFFAETEQVAFCVANIVQGIDFTHDPLLQGRIFSYLDTQLLRLGGPNFHQIPVNAPRCPFANFQRDGLRQMQVPKGRVNYEPNSFDNGAPRENPLAGFTTFPEPISAEKTRRRSETFSDHYSQARMFFRSMSEPEQEHMIGALVFELSKVETVAVRKRMLGHLILIDEMLSTKVEAGLGMTGQADAITPAVQPRDLAPSPALSMIKKAVPTLAGRKVGILLNDGFDESLLAKFRQAVKSEGATLALVAQKIGGAKNSAGELVAADFSIAGGPSVLFDVAVVLTSPEGGAELANLAAAVNWVRDAFGHLKFLAYNPDAQDLIDKAGVMADEGVTVLEKSSSVSSFLKGARAGRIWARETKLREPGA